MKIVSEVLQSVDGIQRFYIVGLLIFVTLFVIILYRTFRRSNKEMTDIKNSILNDDNTGEVSS